VLKCDIKKFFHSIDHQILLSLVQKKIVDDKAMGLIQEIVHSFNCIAGKGVPLGNLTSQLFANIYMNEFDQYVKKNLKIKHYIRYTDDFVFVHNSKKYLEQLVPEISTTLRNKLKLNLHPQKVFIRKANQGVDFLGYVVFPYFTLLRTKTTNRMLGAVLSKAIKYGQKGISYNSFKQTLSSYSGMLKHCRSFNIRMSISKIINNRCNSK
jgi:hypothetical protein